MGSKSSALEGSAFPPVTELIDLGSSTDENAKKWQSGELSDNAFLAKESSQIYRISKWAADKSGQTDLADDVFQELSILLLSKVKALWDPQKSSFSSYISGYAWRVAMAQKSKFSKELHVDSYYDSSVGGEEDVSLVEALGIWGGDVETPDDIIEEIEDDLEQELAKRQLQEKMGGIDSLEKLLDQEIDVLSQKLGLKKAKSTKRRKRKQVKNSFLVSARNELGMTRQEMARFLGMPLHKYASYEDGKIKEVPDEIIDAINELKENMSDRIDLYKSGLYEMDMPEIVDNWMALLGVNTIQELADKLGVALKTVRRWKRGEYKPKPSFIRKYHQRVLEAL
ncbi:XRE family transcriptional regulator [Candidatus Parcubacteria bacterium]|nr:MAG: XRE family transcriptional regulator [Candidatus Parcubacteria bacterium]